MNKMKQSRYHAAGGTSEEASDRHCAVKYNIMTNKLIATRVIESGLFSVRLTV